LILPEIHKYTRKENNKKKYTRKNLSQRFIIWDFLKTIKLEKKKQKENLKNTEEKRLQTAPSK